MPKVSGINWYDSLESTNSEARRLISDCDNLSVIATMSQTAGRGQGDHTWFSTPGGGLTFSLVLKFAPGELPAREEVAVTHLITLSVVEYLKGKGISARIKWPNDVWVDDKKICGVLIEHILHGTDVSASIVGVGLNLNEANFPAELPNPTSITLLTGCNYNVMTELEALYKIICRRAEMVIRPDGRTYTQEEFSKLVFKLSEAR